VRRPPAEAPEDRPARRRLWLNLVTLLLLLGMLACFAQALRLAL